MNTRLAITIGFFALIATACTPHYGKEDGQWAWISYDTGAGRRVRPIEADVGSFEILDNRDYAKDKNQVYYEGRVIDDADPATFEVINDKGFSKDKIHVFINTTQVINADPATFEFIEWPYSKDKNQVYCGTLPLKVEHIEYFEVIESSGMIRTTASDHFIAFNPEYSWIDTSKYKTIVTGEGEAWAGKEKWDGPRKIK